MFSMNKIIPYEGMINENYFKINQRETDLAANLKHLNPYQKILLRIN